MELNSAKCKLFVADTPTKDLIIAEFDHVTPDIKVVTKLDLNLLGAPLTDKALPAALESKIENFQILSGHLDGLMAHHAFHLLRHCLATPRLQYLLRCCPTWKEAIILQKYDDAMKVALEKILNVQLIAS